MVSTFQLTRIVKLCLTHQKKHNEETDKGTTSVGAMVQGLVQGESAEDDELLPAEEPAARDVAASVTLPPAVSAEAGSDSAVPGAPVEAVRETSGKVEEADAKDAGFAATTAAGAPAVSRAGKWSQYLEYVSGGSSKFWQISVSGSEQTVHFGRIGSRGQTLTKSFDDHDSALADAQRQAEGKRRKGYREKNGAE